jgi:hypothetical protein
MSNFEIGKHKMHGLFFKKADQFYDGPSGKKYYNPQNLNVGSNMNANQNKANDQLSGNVPIPGVQEGPAGKNRDMARMNHFQEAANTNVSNIKPKTLASERYSINSKDQQRATNYIGTSLLGGTATNVIAPKIADLPFKAWAAARTAFPSFNSGVIAPAVKAVTDYTNSPK